MVFCYIVCNLYARKARAHCTTEQLTPSVNCIRKIRSGARNHRFEFPAPTVALLMETNYQNVIAGDFRELGNALN